jgi:hypothetical protein
MRMTVRGLAFLKVEEGRDIALELRASHISTKEKAIE